MVGSSRGGVLAVSVASAREEKLQRREEAVQRQLDAAVEKYTPPRSSCTTPGGRRA